MTGQQSSYTESIEKHLRDIRAKENSIGLHYNSIPYQHDFYQRILTLNLEELNRLSIAECANYNVCLMQYSNYILKLYNEYKSICTIIKSKLDIMIAKEIPKYTGSWDVQRQQAINGNSAATALQVELINYQEKYERLDQIHKYISAYADSIKSLQFAKIKEGNTNE